METYSFSKETCWTVLTIDVSSQDNPESIVQGCFSVCEKFEQRYSRFKPGNWLDTINTQHGGELDDEAVMLIKLCLEVAEKTDWLFDPTIISTLESYGYDKDYSFQKKEWWPVGYKHVELRGNELILHNGVRIEFWTVGKWYLLDVMADMMKKAGLDCFILDFWGDIYAVGEYKVGLENPFDLNQLIWTITVNDFAVASSNGKKRKVGDFHHLLDAISGKPVMDIASVYISAKSGLIADTYSTAVFVSGPEKGVQLLHNTPEISGLIVFADGKYRKKSDYSGNLFG